MSNTADTANISPNNTITNLLNQPQTWRICYIYVSKRHQQSNRSSFTGAIKEGYLLR